MTTSAVPRSQAKTTTPPPLIGLAFRSRFWVVPNRGTDISLRHSHGNRGAGFTGAAGFALFALIIGVADSGVAARLPARIYLSTFHKAISMAGTRKYFRGKRTTPSIRLKAKAF